MRISIPATLIGSLGALIQRAVGTINVLMVGIWGQTYTTSFSSSNALAGNTNEQVLAPASNVNGVIVRRRSAAHSSTTAGFGLYMQLLAKASAPAAFGDGDVLLSLASKNATQAGIVSDQQWEEQPYFVAAGKGIYFRNGTANAETDGVRSCLLEVL